MLPGSGKACRHTLRGVGTCLHSSFLGNVVKKRFTSLHLGRPFGFQVVLDAFAATYSSGICQGMFPGNICISAVWLERYNTSLFL